MTEERLPLAELLAKAGDGDFLRSVAEAVLQLLMEVDVEGVIGAGRYERSGERLNWRNGYRDRTLDTRLGPMQLRISVGPEDGVGCRHVLRPKSPSGRFLGGTAMSSPLTAVLARVPYFAGLDPATLARLAMEARERRCAAGELVLAEGEPCPGLSVVVSGRVKAFKLSEDGREQVLRILGAGRTFNDVPLFDDGPNPASVAALEETTVALLPAARIHALVRERPEVAAAVIRVLAQRLRAVTEMVEDLALRGVTARVARLLLQCSRGAPPLAEGAGDHCAHLTQQQLAAMTGSVREVVQRSLKALEREGAIRLARGSIRVLAPDILAAWSGAGRGEG